MLVRQILFADKKKYLLVKRLIVWQRFIRDLNLAEVPS
jgi:hypothetical protein